MSIGTLLPDNRMAPRNQSDALRGSLDLLILKTLSLVPMHGWGITRRIQPTSKGTLDVNLGSLYPPPPPPPQPPAPVPMPGWGIPRRIPQTSKGIPDVNLGSLYPALQRLEKNG